MMAYNPIRDNNSLVGTEANKNVAPKGKFRVYFSVRNPEGELEHSTGVVFATKLSFAYFEVEADFKKRCPECAGYIGHEVRLVEQAL